MWIVYSLLALLAIIITVILVLPVKVIIKNDKDDILILRYRLLFKTYGEDPDPNDPILKALKKAGGIDRLEKAAVQQNIQTDGLQETITESYSLLIDLLKELLFLLKNCTVTKLDIHILSAGDDPAQAAINYGIYQAATHTLLSVLGQFLKIRKRARKIDIRCDFNEPAPVFRYHVVLAVPFARVLAAFWRATMAEVKRTAEETKNQQK